MASNMKTTIDISDALLEEARKIAVKEGTTVKALVEQGLREVVSAKRRKSRFKLRDASFGGEGLQAELSGASWERIRELTYEGRGG